MNIPVPPDNKLCKLPFYVPDFFDESGSFAHVRTHDVHTGVDIFLPEGTPIYALESGVIVWNGQFTGKQADSEWWEDTWAIAVKSKERILVYGELYEQPQLRPGKLVSHNLLIGYVKRVLKVPKGRPMSMLHIEEYDPSVPFTEPVIWNRGDVMPLGLRNPTSFLKETLSTF